MHCAGVEAQTLTVWRQAERYGVPSIAYLNKMDKTGASFQDSVISIQEKLHSLPLVIQLPVGQEKTFCGVIDLISMKQLLWSAKDSTGRTFEQKPLEVSDELYLDALKARTHLVEQLADLDDVIANYVLSDTPLGDIPLGDLHSSLRRVAISRKGLPVLCGSSHKNKGVQPLLDAVVHYLPNPAERQHDFVEYYQDSLCAMAFKTVFDKQRGPLTFLRLYTGSLKSGGTLYNVNRECTEKFSRLLQVSADEHKEVSEATAGNIVAVSGLKEVSWWNRCYKWRLCFPFQADIHFSK